LNIKGKKVLITGAAGYIGSVLTHQLLQSGCKVRGMDILNFGGESLLSVYNHHNFNFIKGDIRDERDVENALIDADAVVHLAAIVGDPACAAQPELAEETNWQASKTLFELAHQTKSIKNFVFASTCSNYGKMKDGDFVKEDSPLRPVSLYAELKVKFEKYILESKTRPDFYPTALRFATVYGISPRLRFDLTVNEFIRELATGNELEIYGEQFWRPYCHVDDLAGACVKVLESEPSKTDHNVYNVGVTRENYKKKMIAEELLKLIPDAKIKYVQKNEDPRDYRVDFTKIKSELGFKITKTVPDGIREIYNLLKDGLLNDPYSHNYKNI